MPAASPCVSVTSLRSQAAWDPLFFRKICNGSKILNSSTERSTNGAVFKIAAQRIAVQGVFSCKSTRCHPTRDVPRGSHSNACNGLSDEAPAKGQSCGCARDSTACSICGRRSPVDASVLNVLRNSRANKSRPETNASTYKRKANIDSPAVVIPVLKRVVPGVGVHVPGLRLLKSSIEIVRVRTRETALGTRHISVAGVIQPRFRIPLLAGTAGSSAGIIQANRQAQRLPRVAGHPPRLPHGDNTAAPQTRICR